MTAITETSRRMAFRKELRGDGPAALSAVEEFCLQFRHWVTCGLMPDTFGAELLLREAMTNAVVHGCKSDASKRVSCVVRVHSDRFLIVVRDSGAGFDWRVRGVPHANDDACSGRGLEIYQCFASRVRFNRQGNTIFLFKKF